MQSLLISALKSAFIAAWPVVEPLILPALYAAIRHGLEAVKAKSIPETSPFKFLDTLGDNMIDDLLAKLPAQ